MKRSLAIASSIFMFVSIVSISRAFAADSIVILSQGQIQPSYSLTTQTPYQFSSSLNDGTIKWKNIPGGHECYWSDNSSGTAQCLVESDLTFTLKISGYSYIYSNPLQLELYDLTKNGYGAPKGVKFDISDGDLSKIFDRAISEVDDQILTTLIQPLTDINNGRLYADDGVCYTLQLRGLVDPSTNVMKNYWTEKAVVKCP